MDNMIVKLLISHFSSNHGVITVLAMALTRIDWVIGLALKVFPAAKLKAGVDWVSAWLDARIDKDAQPQP